MPASGVLNEATSCSECGIEWYKTPPMQNSFGPDGVHSPCGRFWAKRLLTWITPITCANAEMALRPRRLTGILMRRCLAQKGHYQLLADFSRNLGFMARVS